ncbi:glycosyltransferase family 2 protein [Aerococcus tenax]|uniref:glycosyltransferase family 2 protein n=1 Tax=Aerococcus tenax TaxID=3078812 RepID=UPI0018A73186|nr:glycosyltransferase family 2 protein [Aerococcus tenax]
MADITAVILTKNEEINLPDCLNSLKGFAERIVVVDSGSEDRTCEIAEEQGADVYVHEFITHAKQFNWGLDNAYISTAWTLGIDADERLTPDLKKELIVLMDNHEKDDINGITLEADLFFMGRKLKYGGPQKRKLMVFKTGIGRIEDREIDEHTYLLHGKSISAKNRFRHYDFKNLDHFVTKLNWYASREVNDYYNYLDGNTDKVQLKDSVIEATRKKKFNIYYKMPKFLRAILLFGYMYIIKLGFLDGKEGFLYHFLYSCYYRILVDGKILEEQKKR